MSDYKTPDASDIHMALLMQPEHANFGGNIHGGYLLSLMDQAAYACASKFTQKYCVTAAVNTVEFRTPIHVGDLITIRARVNYTGRTSMVVGLRVEAENLIEGTVRHSNSSYFTMVAKTPEGKPSPVPGLILQTTDDVRRFLSAYERREAHRQSDARYAARDFVLTPEIFQWCQTQNAQLSQDLQRERDNNLIN